MIADLDNCDNAEANAAFICRAVNAHDALVEALENINNTIFAAGAPLGSEEYFKIRQWCVDAVEKTKC